MDLNLGLWNDRCGTIHGVTEEEKRGILRLKIVHQVQNSYNNRDKASKDVHHLSHEPVGYCA